MKLTDSDNNEIANISKVSDVHNIGHTFFFPYDVITAGRSNAEIFGSALAFYSGSDWKKFISLQ